MKIKESEKPSIKNNGAAVANPDRGEISSERAAANGENAKLSTGPRSIPGKAVSSQNATRHGFYSKNALIPGETPEEFEAFYTYHFSQLQPGRGTDSLIAEQFVITCWRLQRLERIEAEAFRRYGLSSGGEVMGAGYAMIANIQGDGLLSSLGRYEAGLRRQYFRCLDMMDSLRKSGQFPFLPPPVLDVESVPQNPEPGATVEISPKPATVEGAGGDPAPIENHGSVTKVPSAES